MDTPDQQRIHAMFLRYTNMKAANLELDDVDVATRVARELTRFQTDIQADESKQRKKRQAKKTALAVAARKFSGFQEVGNSLAQEKLLQLPRKNKQRSNWSFEVWYSFSTAKWNGAFLKS